MLSPRSGFSIFHTSAPISPSSVVHHGPAAWWLTSMTRISFNGPRFSIVFPSAELLLQHVGLHFVRGIARQAADELDAAWVLERGEPVTGEFYQRGAGGGRAGCRHD